MMEATAGDREDELQRSSHMADPQDLPADRPEPGPQASDIPQVPTPPADQTPANTAPAKKAVPAKKAPAKKAPAKKAPVAKKSPAKKAPATKAGPPTEAPTAAAQTAEATPAPAPLASTNGSAHPTDGAKEAAAQAKSLVDQASDSVGRPALPAIDGSGRSPIPFVVAFAVSLLAAVLVYRLRQHSDDS
jgi:hypothetical protein